MAKTKHFLSIEQGVFGPLTGACAQVTQLPSLRLGAPCDGGLVALPHQEERRMPLATGNFPKATPAENGENTRYVLKYLNI
jgi:hypothetical protein